MGDKAIISEILEASNLTEAYRNITPKDVIESLVHFPKDAAGSIVKYQGFRDDEGQEEGSAAPGARDPHGGRVHFGSMDERIIKETDKWKSSDYDNETEEEESSPLVNSVAGTFTIDQAVDALGFGKFQIRLSMLTGLAWMADAMEMMILSILSPALRCEWWLESWQLACITTVVFCGMMLSSTMWGKITDKYGRKTELIMCTIITFYYGLISSLAPNFIWLLILRGLAGFGIGGVPQSVTLYAEYLPSAHRAKCVVLIESFWAIGACFETLLALFVMPTLGWRWLLALSSIPMFVFTCCCVWLPESARFQLASGHPELAMETLKRVAEENGRPMIEGKLVDNNIQDVKRGRIVDLLSTELRKTTLLLWFIWMANAFSYYGLVLFTTELFQSSDPCHGGGAKVEEPSCVLECRQLTTKDYVDLVWTSLAEFPGLIITAIIIEWIGRRRTMALEFSVFSLFILLLFFCLNRPTTTIFIIIARAFISGAFQGAYVYTPEVYPTTSRAIGLGSCSAMARLGAIITPFVAQVAAKTSLSIPISVYGVMCLFGAAASLLLPIETKGRELRDFHD